MRTIDIITTDANRTQPSTRSCCMLPSVWSIGHLRPCPSLAPFLSILSPQPLWHDMYSELLVESREEDRAAVIPLGS